MRSNYFMGIIMNKYRGKNPIAKWLNTRYYKKECKKIKSKSHNLGSLWFFSEFIKLAELYFFFDNKNGAYIYSSRSYKYGENGFVINDTEHNIVLKCTLNADEQEIFINIKRTNGTNLSTDLVHNGQRWRITIDDDCSRVLIDNVIAIINQAIIYVLDFCWSANGSYGIYNSNIYPINKNYNKIRD